MKQCRISISRTNRDNVYIVVKDNDFKVIFEAEMSLIDYARLITNEAEIPITVLKGV